MKKSVKTKNIFKLSLILFIFFRATFLLGAAGEESWRFAVLGDSRSNGEKNGVNIEILNELAWEIASYEVDLVLFTGDLVMGVKDLEVELGRKILESQLRTWLEALEPLYQAGIMVYPVRGNHEAYYPGALAWKKVFSGAYLLPENGPESERKLTYTLIHKNALIVALDQYTGAGHQINQAWLDEQLADNQEPHVFAFGHEPAFKVKHKNCLDDFPARRDVFWKSLARAGGRIYFCGHDHMYDHLRADDDNDPDNDLHQFIVGTAGAPFRISLNNKYNGDNGNYSLEGMHRAKAYGYLLVEVKGLAVTVIWMERVSPGEYKAAETWSYTAKEKLN